MTQLAATALKAILTQLDAMDEANNELSSLTPQAQEIAKYVRFNCIAERLSTLEFILDAHDEPTGTLKAINHFSAECVNRLFIMQCTEQLHCEDLIRDLRKFAVNHLPLVDNQTAH